MGRVWNKHLVAKLKEARFKQSAHEEFSVCYKCAIYVSYIVDLILTSPDPKELREAIVAIQAIRLDLTFGAHFSRNFRALFDLSCSVSASTPDQ